MIVARSFGHSHDPEPGCYVEMDPAWFDRRALERAGWLIEDPDGLRGEPFERAIHPTALKDKTAMALVKSGLPLYPTTPDDVNGEACQIVYAPVGESTRTWANTSWQKLYPRLYAWFMDDNHLRAVRCHGVVFIKSDF